VRRLAAATTAVALAILTGCGPRAAKAPAAADAIVFRTTSPAEALAPLLAEFESANPGLHVRLEIVDCPPDADTLLAARAGGPRPDLCEVPDGPLPRLVATGRLSDWSAGVADLRDSLRGWPACMVGESIYALPWRLDAVTLCWNPQLFARARLDAHHAPRTWDEVRQAAVRLAALHGGVHALGLSVDDSTGTCDDFLPWAWSRGGGVCAGPHDSVCVGGDENVAALEFLAALPGAVRLASRETLQAEFAHGTLGMLLADGDSWGAIARLPGAGRFAAAPVPAWVADSSQGVTLGRVVALASPADARHREGALRLARFLSSAHCQYALASTSWPMLPSLAGCRGRVDAGRDGTASLRAAVLARARFAQPTAQWNDIRRAIGAAVEDALRGRAEPGAALATADSEVVALMGHR